MAGEVGVGEAAGALPLVGPAGVAAVRHAVAAVAPSPMRQWLAINLSWWWAAAAAAAVAARVGARQAGAAVGVTAPQVGVQVGAPQVGVVVGAPQVGVVVTAPQVGVAVMVGPQATAAAIPEVALPTRIGVTAPARLGPATALARGCASRGSLALASALAPASSRLGSGASSLDLGSKPIKRLWR